MNFRTKTKRHILLRLCNNESEPTLYVASDDALIMRNYDTRTETAHVTFSDREFK
jgi:hypothetical protein